MKDNPFRNYRYVMEYDTEQTINEQLIRDLLKEAIFTTPSKQNMMPYKIHVITNEKLKYMTFIKCMLEENSCNEEHVKKIKKVYQHNNIENAHYLLLFTQRLGTANPYHQDLANRGWNFEQIKSISASQSLSLIELGMFAQNFGMLCLQNNIDISHTRCFPQQLKFWSEPEFKFLENPVKLIMTVGKAKRYRRDQQTHLWPDYDADHKPDFEEVVSFT